MDVKAPVAQSSFDRLMSAADRAHRHCRRVRHGLCRPAARHGRLGRRLYHPRASTTTRRRSPALAAGESYLKHIAPEKLSAMARDERFSPTGDFDRLAECDVIVICVPTPLGAHREPDLTYVENTGARRSPSRLRPGQLVVLESTTYPGTTAELVAAAPRERPACKSAPTSSSPSRPSARIPAIRTSHAPAIPKVVGGDGDRRRCELAMPLLRRSSSIASSRSPRAEVAEAVKLTENIFRAVNIALVNELKVIYDAMGIDVWEVIEAAKTKPFGYMPFYPGPGPRRPLHPDRPVLPDLEGARVRPAHALHRAGRRDQPAHAGLCGRAARRGARPRVRERA